MQNNCIFKILNCLKYLNIFGIDHSKFKSINKDIMVESNTNYFDFLPFEILLIIFDFLDFVSKINFFYTCKIYWKQINLQNIDANLKSVLYEGISFVNIIPTFVSDKLNGLSKNIRELVLITSNNSVDLFDIYFNLPNLKKLKLISDAHIFLNQWEIPLLTHLDIKDCQHSILYNCHFPNLTHLYIDSFYGHTLRFCDLPLSTKIIKQYQDFIFMDILDNAIRLEKFNAKIVKDENILGIAIEDDIVCFECQNSANIIKSNAFCNNCHIIRPLTREENKIINEYPHCKNNKHEKSVPLKIMMNIYGHGSGYCFKCDVEYLLRRPDMYAAGIITGYEEYPLIK